MVGLAGKENALDRSRTGIQMNFWPLIDVGTVISFYNGVRVRSGHDWERPTPCKMLLDETSDIDLPENMTKLENYRATLGHKVCHSFEPNSETDVFYHPRFGLIRCIATIDNIKAGEEIPINYG
jgi:histone-lysine N-methyltransferase SETD7